MNSLQLASISVALLIASIAREIAALTTAAAHTALAHTERGANWLTARCDAARARLEARQSERALVAARACMA